ncbi:MAG: hypothetical protein LH471_10205 [Salinibacterium sp.]|nr:hypothetical protein [Salinibacterium sp.]
MNIIGFVVSLALFVGGFYLMGSAFYVPGFELVLFLSGIFASTLGVIIPIHVLNPIDS